MTWATISHRGLSLNFICLLVDDEGVLCYDCSNLILFLLSADAEHLVMDLDACKVPWQNIGVAQSNLWCGLRLQVMDHQLRIGFVIVMKAWLFLWQNEIGLEADHIVQETAELIDLTAHNYIWPGVVLKISIVHLYGLLERVTLPGKVLNLIAKLKNGKEVSRVWKLLLLLNSTLKITKKLL